MLKIITCTIWKEKNGCYAITVNDFRYREFDTECITSIDVLFNRMQELSEALKRDGYTVYFSTACTDKRKEII